ncbi:MAG: 16S rRNA (cytosine(967)-C(5))-methyltransferase RsmB, partial [Acidobacteria bacterium]|nr:16S rRNA (cytosine(967)-C(5))-methyltransferase RsmB [Acidobacteriota bacterium]
MAVRVIKKKGVKGGRRQGSNARALVTPARRAAFNVLQRVEEDGAFAAVLLAHVAEELRADDRALCYELTLGVLRRQLWLDKLIEHYAGRKAEQIDAPVRRALRLGLYQLRFLTRVPASAAVNESVNLAHAEKLGGAAKFINAVLRRATREPDFDPASLARDEIERLAIETSHPRWLIERWIEAFGRDETAAFAHANNQTPPVALRVNEWKQPVAKVIEQLRAAGVEVKASEVAPAAWRVVSGGGAAVRELARAGIIYTQDEASQLVAHVLGARAGERVLDVCAAPGSKATHIAGLAGAEARVVAGDLYSHRLRV